MGRTAMIVLGSACFVLLGVATASFAGANASNGVYGGYVGSDRWFQLMRESAEHRAALSAIAGSHGAQAPQKLPPDYVEFAGQIVLPEGNRFPKGRLPDLRIVPRDRSADSVERAPHLDRDGGFYTVLKRGQTYDVFWMYYFGSREKFGTIVVDPNASAVLRQAIAYHYPASKGDKGNPASQGPGAYTPPQAGPGDVTPRVGPGLVEPKVGPGLVEPRTGPGFVSPKVGEGYVPPGSR